MFIIFLSSIFDAALLYHQSCVSCVCFVCGCLCVMMTVEEEDDDMYGAALRGVFIIDPSQKIRSIHLHDDSVGRNVQEVLRVLEAFQYADSHSGEACPAGWQPGDKSIMADHEGSKDFFKDWGTK